MKRRLKAVMSQFYVAAHGGRLLRVGGPLCFARRQLGLAREELLEEVAGRRDIV